MSKATETRGSEWTKKPNNINSGKMKNIDKQSQYSYGVVGWLPGCLAEARREKLEMNKGLERTTLRVLLIIAEQILDPGHWASIQITQT